MTPSSRALGPELAMPAAYAANLRKIRSWGLNAAVCQFSALPGHASSAIGTRSRLCGIALLPFVLARSIKFLYNWR